MKIKEFQRRASIRVHSRLAVFILLVLFAVIAPAATVTTVTYQPYRFEPSEGWFVTGPGDRGATSLKGHTWHFDFSKGAQWLGLSLPDRSLFTTPQRFRLRVRGEAAGHPVYVSLRTHFMTFHKVVGQLAGKGEQELVFDAPPGEGWQWGGGENDGKIHGPLRLGEIRLEANGKTDRGTLELLSFEVEGQCPPDKLAIMSAAYVPANDAGVFRANLHWLGSTSVAATVECVVQDWQKRALTQSRRAFTLKPGGEPQTIDFPALVPATKDLRFMEAVFRLEVPGQSLKPVEASWLAPVPAREDARLQP